MFKQSVSFDRNKIHIMYNHFLNIQGFCSTGGFLASLVEINDRYKPVLICSTQSRFQWPNNNKIPLEKFTKRLKK
jgi:hypothetical protein